MSDSGFGAPASVTPTCYRHPDETTYIRCQRCERPVCVRCQTQAPVGVLCPDCVHQAKARIPKAQGFYSSQSKPVVTYTLILISAIVYVLQWIPGLNITNSLAYAPVFSYGEYTAIGGSYEPWRMITAVFTHSTGFIFHILLNMYTLWVFGQLLERMLGGKRFLALYLGSGLAGSLGVMFWSDHLVFVVGASGAIFGLLGAFLIIQRKLGGDTTQLLVLVGINLVIGFLPGMSISWQAHLGGLIGGAILGLIFVQTRQPNRRKLQWPLISVAFAMMLALALSHAPILVL